MCSSAQLGDWNSQPRQLGFNRRNVESLTHVRKHMHYCSISASAEMLLAHMQLCAFTAPMPDSYKEQSIAYLREALTKTNLRPSELAKKIGVSSTTLTRPLNSPEHAHALSGRTLQKIAAFMGERLPTELQDFADVAVYETDREAIDVPEYDVRLAAGGGFIIDRETVRDTWRFSYDYLVNQLGLRASSLVIAEVVGDSMAPTLESGDRVLVDQSDQRVGNPGVFACWDGDGLVVKRLERVMGADPPLVRVISDNPRHHSYEIPADMCRVIGRVRWRAHRM